MKLSADVRLPFGRETVYVAYRDEMGKVLEFLPSVRAVDLKARREDALGVHLVREWHGGGEVPAAVRGIVTESMLAWDDYATWDATSYSCDWQIESRSFPDALRCRGRTSFVDEGAGQTLLALRGTIEVQARRLPGVPPFLAVSVARSVEEFLVDKIESNVRHAVGWFERNRP
jgi:hypothetical protein